MQFLTEFREFSVLALSCPQTRFDVVFFRIGVQRCRMMFGGVVSGSSAPGKFDIFRVLSIFFFS